MPGMANRVHNNGYNHIRPPSAATLAGGRRRVNSPLVFLHSAPPDVFWPIPGGGGKGRALLLLKLSLQTYRTLAKQEIDDV